jgi:hypothetical protein
MVSKADTMTAAEMPAVSATATGAVDDGRLSIVGGTSPGLVTIPTTPDDTPVGNSRQFLDGPDDDIPPSKMRCCWVRENDFLATDRIRNNHDGVATQWRHDGNNEWAGAGYILGGWGPYQGCVCQL